MSGGQATTAGVGDVIYGEFFEGTPLTFRAYVTKENGAVLLNTDVSGNVSLNVFQRSGATPTTAVYTNASIAVASSAVAALSTTGWLRGGSGFNFTVSLSSSAFTQAGGMNYRYEFNIPLLAGGNIAVIFELYCRGVI